MPLPYIYRLVRHLRWQVPDQGATGHLTTPDTPPRPITPICLIGDIHGRRDLLDDMLDRLAEQPDAARAHLVTLGDMIDRGPDSAGVVSRLMQDAAAHLGRRVHLMGNHERMMLDFLVQPAANHCWLASGGRETLISYGVRPEPDRPAAMAEALRAAMPAAHLDWLAARPLYWLGEGIAAVHANADPARPIPRQDEKTLLWGKGPQGPRADGLWIATGHVVQDQPTAANGRIALDTGAWRTGVLSAAWLDRRGARFLQVRR